MCENLNCKIWNKNDGRKEGGGRGGRREWMKVRGQNKKKFYCARFEALISVLITRSVC